MPNSRIYDSTKTEPSKTEGISSLFHLQVNKTKAWVKETQVFALPMKETYLRHVQQLQVKEKTNLQLQLKATSNFNKCEETKVCHQS